jgi:hypothetical protein
MKLFGVDSYIDKNNKMNRKIYYVSLTPLKIKKILSKSEGQKTKSLELKVFPSDSAKKYSLFLQFYNDSKNQITPIKTNSLISLEDLSKNNLMGNYNITCYNCCNFQDIIFEDEIYLYAEDKNNKILQPIEDGPISILSFEEVVNINVIVGREIFYDSFTRTISKDEIVIKIGDSFFITIPQNNSKSKPKVKYISTPMLRRRIIDLKFLTKILREKIILIGDLSISLVEESNNSSIESIEEEMKLYKNTIDALNCLHIEDDINIDNLTSQAKYMTKNQRH